MCKQDRTNVNWTHLTSNEGIPHASVEEEIYQDMRIPARSTVIPNIWSVFITEAPEDDTDQKRQANVARRALLP